MNKTLTPKLSRWVVKAGSQLICAGGPLLLRAWMHQVAILKRQYNVEVIWVTSGAIASAKERTQFNKRKRSLVEKQALSAIGQPLIMDLYNLALQTTGLLGGQILLTYGDLEDPVRRANFRDTTEKLLEWGVVPVINENDAIATEEVQLDNDTLSARVAHFAKADRLVILTDVNGLYDSNPTLNPKAKLIRKAKCVTPKMIESVSSEVASERGRGGMLSKLRAAKYANDESIETWIVKGDSAAILLEIAENRALGTVIGSHR